MYWDICTERCGGITSHRNQHLPQNNIFWCCLLMKGKNCTRRCLENLWFDIVFISVFAGKLCSDEGRDVVCNASSAQNFVGSGKHNSFGLLVDWAACRSGGAHSHYGQFCCFIDRIVSLVLQKWQIHVYFTMMRTVSLCVMTTDEWSKLN